jgi:hypothetical protein
VQEPTRKSENQTQASIQRTRSVAKKNRTNRGQRGRGITNQVLAGMRNHERNQKASRDWELTAPKKLNLDCCAHGRHLRADRLTAAWRIGQETKQENLSSMNISWQLGLASGKGEKESCSALDLRAGGKLGRRCGHEQTEKTGREPKSTKPNPQLVIGSGNRNPMALLSEKQKASTAEEKWI